MIDFNKSKIEACIWCDLPFLVKRDDLISPYVNGNKAYKFYFLLEIPVVSMVSFGGNQSNAMLALAHLAKYKKATFTYFTPPLSRYLADNIEGNLKLALDLGMNLKFSNDMKKDALRFAKENDALFIPQGGASKAAKEGIKILANEILELNLKNLCVFCSSGTGSMSFYLQYFLKPYGIKVFTTHCIGDAKYLQKQFLDLDKDSNVFPQILALKQKLPFAKPNLLILEIYQAFLAQKIEFDLLYDCVMWRAIGDNKDLIAHYDNRLFLHSGGLSANKTQLKRYDFIKSHFA